MSQSSLGDRLKEIVKSYRSENAAAIALGLSNGTLRSYLSGTSPSAEKAAQIALAAKVEIRWLITGEGPKDRSDGAMQPAQPALNIELFGHVVDRVSRTYKAAGVRLSELDLGRIAAERYPEIAAFNAPRDEWPPLLELLAIRLRKEIAAAAAVPGSGKASA